MVFDDLIKPWPGISDESRTSVYDRLPFDTDYGFRSYMDALRDRGFRNPEYRDLSGRLPVSCSRLSRRAAMGTDPERRKRFANRSDAYLKLARAVRNDEFDGPSISA